MRIYLSEAIIDEAVACVGEKETFGIGDETLMQLAEAAHASHSSWVIRLARRQASRIMDENRAAHYENAARWLKKMPVPTKHRGERGMEAELRHSFSSISGNISFGRCWRLFAYNWQLQQGFGPSDASAIMTANSDIARQIAELERRLDALDGERNRC